MKHAAVPTGRNRLAALAAGFVLLGSIPAPAQAAPGDLDPSFGDGGRVVTALAERGSSGAVSALRQPDGKTVIAATGDPRFLLLRVNPDGTLDESFSEDGKQHLSIIPGRPGALIGIADAVLQPDGKIVALGIYEAGFDPFDFAVVRFNADGSVDPTFGDGGFQTIDSGEMDFGNAIALQPDGRIVIAGRSAVSDFSLARLNPDGSLDQSFSGDGQVRTDAGPFLGARDIAIQPDGRIVAVGSGNEGGEPGPLGFAVLRYNPDGTLDSSFSGDGKQFTDFPNSGNDEALGVAIQPDGRIVAVGSRAVFQQGGDFAVARYNPDGSPDTSFSGDGQLITDLGGAEQANAVTLQPDGRIVAVGRRDGDFALVRYNPDGSLDSGFSSDGTQTTSFGETFAQQPNAGAAGLALADDGSLLAVGRGGPRSGDVALAQYNPDGSLDTGFSDDGKQTFTFPGDDLASDLAIQDDGKIVTVGNAFDGFGRFALARHNPDGTLDESFSEDGKQLTDVGTFANANTVAVDDDGRIVVAGTIESAFGLARYNPDGTLDESFSDDGTVTTPVNEFGGAISDLAIDEQGRIVAVGAFGGFGPQGFGLARYNPDGTLDESFSEDGLHTVTFDGGSSDARSVVIQPDGKIVVVGGSGNQFALARLNPDGALDASFSGDGRQVADVGGTGFGFFTGANAVALQPDGRIVVAGAARNDDSDLVVARFNPDGSLDAGFAGDGTQVTDIAGNDGALGVVVQPDGRIVATGFTQDDVATVRYNPDGSLDESFAADGVQTTDFAGGHDSGSAVALQGDGGIVVAGGAQGETHDFALLRFEGSAVADTTPPQTTITGGPAEGATVSGSTVSFTFEADEADSTFECALDGASFETCESPHQLSDLGSGEHEFTVRATDPAGNTDPTPASRSFRVCTGGLSGVGAPLGNILRPLSPELADLTLDSLCG